MKHNKIEQTLKTEEELMEEGIDVSMTRQRLEAILEGRPYQVPQRVDNRHYRFEELDSIYADENAKRYENHD